MTAPARAALSPPFFRIIAILPASPAETRAFTFLRSPGPISIAGGEIPTSPPLPSAATESTAPSLPRFVTERTKVATTFPDDERFARKPAPGRTVMSTGVRTMRR